MQMILQLPKIKQGGLALVILYVQCFAKAFIPHETFAYTDMLQYKVFCWDFMSKTNTAVNNCEAVGKEVMVLTWHGILECEPPS